MIKYLGLVLGIELAITRKMFMHLAKEVPILVRSQCMELQKHAVDIANVYF